MTSPRHRAARALAILLLALSIGCSGRDDRPRVVSLAADEDASVLDTARAVADTWIDTYAPESIGWSWDQGILMLGIWDLYEVTGEARYRDYVAAWMDARIAEGYSVAYNDAARVALRLWIDTGEDRYAAVVDDARDYIFHDAPRMSDGGLARAESLSGGEMLADTLFTAAFLVELGEARDDDGARAEAVFQFDRFAEHLRDPNTGLYHHRFNAETGALDPEGAEFWGRCNGWILASSGLALDTLPPGYAGTDDIAVRFTEQLASMAALMDESGRWHTVMNRPETYLETSVGPLVAYGVDHAEHAGIAGEDELAVARAALRGALDQVVTDESGGSLLLGTSFGTGPATTWEMYDYVLKGEQVSYGVGLLLQAVAARERLDPDGPLPARHLTREDYIHAPDTTDAAEWGYFELARGDFTRALEFFEADLTADSAAADSAWGAGLVEAARFVFDIIDAVSAYSAGDLDLTGLLGSILSEGRETGASIAERMDTAAADPDFHRVMERFVITEMGGSMALGAEEIDRGEVLLLGGVARLIAGAADVADAVGLDTLLAVARGDTPPSALLGLPKGSRDSLVAGLGELIAGLDGLLAAIDEIDHETDDQSDDLIPRNLLHLEGDFHLPGILMPTPVTELLAQLGLDPETLFGGAPMPQALIDLLTEVRDTLAGMLDWLD